MGGSGGTRRPASGLTAPVQAGGRKAAEIGGRSTSDLRVRSRSASVVICRLMSGTVEITTDRGREQFQRGDLFLLVDTHDHVVGNWSDTDYRLTRLPLKLLYEVAANSRDSLRPLIFLGRRPITSAAARRWLQVRRFAEQHLAEVGSHASSTVRDSITRLVAAMTLETFPNTLTSVPERQPSHADLPATVALALDFIERNADTTLRVRDIAASVSISERGLQLAFRLHLNLTPAAFLRQFRLSKVHEELANSSPTEGTRVTDVALKWGFSNSSRFVQHYRDLYGELPRETLRQTPDR